MPDERDHGAAFWPEAKLHPVSGQLELRPQLCSSDLAAGLGWKSWPSLNDCDSFWKAGLDITVPEQPACHFPHADHSYHPSKPTPAP